MRIEFYCTRWGSEDVPWEKFLHDAKHEGYDGVEYGIASTTTTKELDQIWNLLTKFQLKVIPQHFDTNDADFSSHVQKYETWLKKVVDYPCEKINLQTGKDYFSFKQNSHLIEIAKKYADAFNVKIVHETHRGKFSFAAHMMKEYLEKIDDLEITLDISHWINVAESYLDDQMEVVKLATDRTEHIHARVGYPEGPQIPDPRTEEWQEALTRHLLIWDMVVNRKAQQDSVLTITTEFGAPPYMVLIPGSKKPIADQWEVNRFMMQLLKDRYKKLSDR